MMKDWPFAEPPNEMVVTVRSVVTGDKPVLYVCHEEDWGWQFLDGGKVRNEDAVLVNLRFILARDPSIAQLADLPPGSEARRAAIDSPWFRKVPTST